LTTGAFIPSPKGRRDESAVPYGLVGIRSNPTRPAISLALLDVPLDIPVSSVSFPFVSQRTKCGIDTWEAILDEKQSRSGYIWFLPLANYIHI
jgi:hypothetical protein